MSQQEFRPRSFQILPPVVKNILIISGILFLAQVVLEYKMNFRLENYLGLHYYSADYFKPYQFITYIFMQIFLFPVFKFVCTDVEINLRFFLSFFPEEES